ncbi:tRNA1(Val) (adenine(37)-N6)-methyltransferase [Lutimonas zeaxanthinifaciens]|uniref:tRNA1(Val) (adenine(37)-N6)-methyltransferase n=1 Tax=Lutimonas zeaxanthinifaciens TaxID=3060215 RepID=UPI00265D0677|nr:methyltransferase [Lutimonas sp. YSD2104]WKK66739.1 methyltransferase [Lutimonas sp. YSD2104]
MKIGTDGVLLGGWVHIPENIESILDIGTGTGLLAMQMAQRSNAELIDALEIEDAAYEQAVENFEDSAWADRLFCYHASLQDFVEEIDDQYDLIICNPPYYTDTFKELNPKRALARHTHELNFQILLKSTSKLLKSNGQCAFIIPFKEEDVFLKLAETFQLNPIRITRVRGNISSPLKRSLIQFSKQLKNKEINELAIEVARHQYTEDYKELVKDFYLEM